MSGGAAVRVRAATEPYSNGNLLGCLGRASANVTLTTYARRLALAGSRIGGAPVLFPQHRCSTVAVRSPRPAASGGQRCCNHLRYGPFVGMRPPGPLLLSLTRRQWASPLSPLSPLSPRAPPPSRRR